MAIFYVDLENVHSSGLYGVDTLTENDRIILFTSDKADTLQVGTAEALFRGKAKVEIIPCINGTLNALDFQLVAKLFYELDENDNDRLIVSNDGGYDAAIEMGKKLGHNNIRRIPRIAAYKDKSKEPVSVRPLDELKSDENISKKAPAEVQKPEEPAVPAALSTQKEPAIQLSKKGLEAANLKSAFSVTPGLGSMPDRMKMMQLFKKADNAAKFYQSLLKAFGQKQGIETYQKIKPYYSEWEKLKK